MTKGDLLQVIVMCFAMKGCQVLLGTNKSGEEDDCRPVPKLHGA